MENAFQTSLSTYVCVLVFRVNETISMNTGKTKYNLKDHIDILVQNPTVAYR